MVERGHALGDGRASALLGDSIAFGQRRVEREFVKGRVADGVALAQLFARVRGDASRPRHCRTLQSFVLREDGPDVGPCGIGLVLDRRLQVVLRKDADGIGGHVGADQCGLLRVSKSRADSNAHHERRDVDLLDRRRVAPETPSGGLIIDVGVPVELPRIGHAGTKCDDGRPRVVGIAIAVIACADLGTCLDNGLDAPMLDMP